MQHDSARLPWRAIHFIGAGGVGMAGLALIVAERGVAISGSDEADSANLARLRRLGPFALGHRAANLAAPDLVVYSSAVPADNPELAAARTAGLPCQRRGDFLAELATCFPIIVAVAGSHGKTTVTAMLAGLLTAVGRRPGYLIGGQPVDLDLPATAGAGELLITEVDESDTTQARLRSHHAIVVNIDDDHCWSVGGVDALHACFRQFGLQANCLVTGDSPLTRALFGDHPRVDFVANEDDPATPRLAVPGRHNRFNARLVVALAEGLGVTAAESWRYLQGFRGVERRQSLRYAGHGIRVIEDYAHHPVEVRATLQAMREAWPGHRLRVVFQPHRYERVARYTEAFARELAAADEVIVTKPFSAWLADESLADPARIASAIEGIPAGYRSDDWAAIAVELAQSSRDGDIIAVIGAGTITRLVPLLGPALDRHHSAT